MENNITKMLIENKPAAITYAFRLILFSILIGIINLIKEFYQGAFYYYSTFGVIVLSSVIALFIFYIGALISRGKNLARYLYLILFITGTPYILPVILDNFKFDLLSFTLNLLLLISDTAVLILIFSRQSGEWFRKIKNSRTR